MKRLLIITATLLCLVPAFAEVLEVIGVKTETVYENRTFEHVNIQGSKYITLRNCTIKGATEYYAACIRIDGSNYITIENCDIDGNAKACNGINNHGSGRVLVRGCRIYNCNDDGIEHHDGTLSDYVGNRIYNLRSCGTDGGCSPCNNGHSDGIEIRRGIRVNVVGNMHYGSMNTSCLFIGQTEPVSTDVVLHNNIMYGSTCGYTAYLWYCNRLKAYNNIFWHARYGGIWWGVNLTDSYFRNNIVGGKFTFKNTSYNAANHHIDNNLFTVDFTKGSNNIKNGTPQFAGTPSKTNLNPDAFKIKSNSPCINKGIDDGNLPETDHFSLGRAGIPDIGVHEYGGSFVTDMDREAAAPELNDVLTLQVYPSPMDDMAYFSMALMEVEGPVNVILYDRQGRMARSLRSPAGSAVAAWDGKDGAGRIAAAGVYFYTAKADGHTVSGSIIKR